MRVAFLLLLCLACTERTVPQATSSADTAGAPSPPAAAAADPVARFRARVPDSVFIHRGACPFECCRYGEWRTTAAVPVFRSQRLTGVAFTMPEGQPFLADSGTVFIDDVLLIAVHDSVGDPPYWSFVPGDTLVVLDYVGEGRYRAWHEGKVLEVEGFWGAERMPLVAEMIGRWTSEWWVHVTLPDGRTGWVDASPPARFRGADACAGP